MSKDIFNRSWIIDNSLEEIQNYAKGILTIRSLHYRLVSRGMTNSNNHYSRVKSAMTWARWEGLVDFDQFSDNDREVLGETRYQQTVLEDEVEQAKESIETWMTAYYKNRWENQPIYPEVWIEKKALQGVFMDPCSNRRVSLSPCKGYPSLTFLNEAALRFSQITDKQCVILYFGDYDPSGEDIPRSIQENLNRLGADVEVQRILLMKEQVLAMGLPPAPTKSGDTRSVNWDGLGQVELDAVEPRLLQRICGEAIDDVFDRDLHDELKEQEELERAQYVAELKEHVKSL